jgi:hypothetical protein
MKTLGVWLDALKKGKLKRPRDKTPWDFFRPLAKYKSSETYDLKLVTLIICEANKVCRKVPTVSAPREVQPKDPIA